MNNFNTNYLCLLKRHVDEEINFLKAANHHASAHNPCYFCYESNHGEYMCHRLSTMQQYQRELICQMDKENKKNGDILSATRRRIGYMGDENQETACKDTSFSEIKDALSYNLQTNNLMPLLNPKL